MLDNKYIMNKEEIIINILDSIEEFSYKDKISLIFKMIPQSDFHNYRWRERIQLESLNIIDNRGNKIHGSDSETHSLKSSKLSKNKDGKFKIYKSTSLGTFGRLDKDKTHDKKDTLCTIFDDNGNVIFELLIKYDDRFETMYRTEQDLKRTVMENNKQTRDSLSISLNLINKYNLTYEIRYMGNNIIMENTENTLF